jgi:ribonuclease HI
MVAKIIQVCYYLVSNKNRGDNVAKVYAVKKGRAPGIYKTWEETKEQVIGFSGAEYKSFTGPTEEDARYLAREYIKGKVVKPTDDKLLGDTKVGFTPYELAVAGLTKDDAVAYTDGSYNEATERCGAAYIYIVPERTKPIIFHKKHHADGMRQIRGELEAVEYAIEKAIEDGKKTIEIRYDYTGIEKWATGEWKANNSHTRRYQYRIEELKKKIEIKFHKVDAHTGDVFNELADLEAKRACGKV